MIEINLSPKQKTTSLTNVAGIDLSLLNVKMIFAAILFLYIPESALISYYDSEIETEKAIQKKLNTELRALTKKVKSMSNIKKQVDALKEQERKLSRKLSVVKEIINKRQNPFEVMRYVTENTPENLWLTKLELKKGQLIFQGLATDFNSIGEFLAGLKNSIFFSKDISYNKPKGLKDEYRGVRMESFQIKARVLNFQ